MLEDQLERIAVALERLASHVESVTVATTRPATAEETDEAEGEKPAKRKAAAAKKKAAAAKKKAEAEAKDPVDENAGEDGPDIEDLRAKVRAGIVLGLKSEIKDLFSAFDCGSVTTMDEAKYSDFEVALDTLIEKAEAEKDDE